MSNLTKPPLFRYMNKAVGSFILITFIVTALMLFQSGRIQNWFDPGETIKVLLPREGLFGLGEGADAYILGTKAGEVTRIVIDPDKRIHADVQVRRDFMSFVRVDSTAIIRKRFGVAGEVYLEITRGTGAPVDWKLAVIEAEADRGPTEILQVVVEELQSQILPAIKDTRQSILSWKKLADKLNDPQGDLSRLVANLNSISAKFDRGDGSFGKLLTDDSLVKELEGLVGNLRMSLGRIAPVLEELQKTSKNITQMTVALSSESKELPALTRQIKQTLGSLSDLLGDLKRTTKDLPQITKSVSQTTENMPSLVLQSQETMRELEKLIKQLQNHWLLGKSGREQEVPKRISPVEAGR